VNIRKHFFMMRVVKHWNKFPRKVVDPHPWKRSRSIWMGL